MIAAVAYIVPAIVFILFGSGNVQPWNESSTAIDEKKTNDDAVAQA